MIEIVIRQITLNTHTRINKYNKYLRYLQICVVCGWVMYTCIMWRFAFSTAHVMVGRLSQVLIFNFQFEIRSFVDHHHWHHVTFYTSSGNYRLHTSHNIWHHMSFGDLNPDPQTFMESPSPTEPSQKPEQKYLNRAFRMKWRKFSLKHGPQKFT